ncbi:MAG: NFACT family protein [Oscillospiraceae bacterium]|nr:NFACT family protein [Oscillospiraceae bacterium]
MPLDAMVLTALRREMEKPLLGAKIDRISMPEKDMLVLSVHSREEGNHRLLISLRPGSARIHFTSRTFYNPPQPPMFCMLLRKHLSSARFTALEQPVGERVLLLRFDTTDEMSFHAEKTLALELMGKGINLSLIGEDGRIIDCFRRVDYSETARRAVLPGLYYELPPAQEKPSVYRLDREELSGLIRGANRSAEPDRWLLNSFSGLSPLLCRELAVSGWEGLEESVLSLRGMAENGGFNPCMLLENGQPRDFSFLPIRQYGEAMEQRIYPDFCTLLDDFYSLRDKSENMRRRSGDLTRTAKSALTRLRRKLAAREQELLATENREEYRRRGDLITANIYRLQRGMKSFEAQDYYQEDCPTVTVPLDAQKTPQQNAAVNYKLYNKAKTANRMLTGLIASAREEEQYLESVMEELARAESDRDLAEIRAELLEGGYIRPTGPKKMKRPAPRKPMRFRSDSGRLILAGRGNLQNDELTLHTARRTDLWFHVQKLPGSHVILSQAEGEADELSIRQAAALAATFSQAAAGGKTAVDYTMVRNVKKPSGARPGRVIYTDYKTVIAQSDHALAERLRIDKDK